MADSEDPTTFAARLATFERPHHFSKRRASSAKKKAQSAVSWPHQTPAPEALARAGFYYRPSSTSHDSVTCFLCSKALDGWEAGDNPAEEHLSHVPDCGWAINICIEQRSQDMDRVEEDPLSEKMMKARRDTFRDAWPHESRKGWKCKVDNMVKAGWCYDPLPEADDFVKCYYCGLSLDGWEPKDDPWVEHQKRAPDCHFFTLIDESAKLAQLKKGKGRTSRASKASRMSTQSNMTTTSEALPDADLDDDSVAEIDGTVLTTTSTTTKAKRGQRTGVKRAAPKRAVAKRTRAGSVVPASGPEPAEVLQSESHDDSDAAPDESMAQPPKARGKRQVSRIRSQPEDREESEVIRPVRKASRAKPTPRERVSEDASQLQQELEAAEESVPPPVPVKNTARATRGKKRTSDGQENLESSIVQPSQPIEEVNESTQPKAARKGRTAKKVIEDSIIEDSPPELEDEPQPKRGRGRPSKTSAERSETLIGREPLRPVEEPSRSEEEPAPKRGRGRPSNTATEASVTEVLPVIEAQNPQPKRKRGRPSKQSLNSTADEPAQAEDIPEVITAPVQTQKAMGKKARVASQQQQPESTINKPSTPHHTVSSKAQPDPPTPIQSAKASAEKSASASPQSSDAENHPPSSRPSLASHSRLTPSESQTHILRVSLATTPCTSPSKRNIINSLHSAQPWTAVDLETIFLPSPNQRGMSNESLDLENVLQHLTNPERSMSVEEWILWNAKGAEERLRGECERMIGAFETEGNRALQSLESVEVLAV